MAYGVCTSLPACGLKFYPLLGWIKELRGLPEFLGMLTQLLN